MHGLGLGFCFFFGRAKIESRIITCLFPGPFLQPFLFASPPSAWPVFFRLPSSAQGRCVPPRATGSLFCPAVETKRGTASSHPGMHGTDLYFHPEILLNNTPHSYGIVYASTYSVQLINDLDFQSCQTYLLHTLYNLDGFPLCSHTSMGNVGLKAGGQSRTAPLAGTSPTDVASKTKCVRSNLSPQQ